MTILFEGFSLQSWSIGNYIATLLYWLIQRTNMQALDFYKYVLGVIPPEKIYLDDKIYIWWPQYTILIQIYQGVPVSNIGTQQGYLLKQYSSQSTRAELDKASGWLMKKNYAFCP